MEAKLQMLDRKCKFLQMEINKFNEDINLLQKHAKQDFDGFFDLFPDFLTGIEDTEANTSVVDDLESLKEMVRCSERVSGVQFTNFGKSTEAPCEDHEDRKGLEAYWAIGQANDVNFHVKFHIGSEGGRKKMQALKITLSNSESFVELKDFIEMCERKVDLQLFFWGLSDSCTLCQHRKEVVDTFRKDYSACINVKVSEGGGFEFLAFNTKFKRYFTVTWRIQFDVQNHKMMSFTHFEISNYGNRFYEREQELFKSLISPDPDSVVQLWKDLAHAVKTESVVDAAKEYENFDTEDSTMETVAVRRVRERMKNRKK